VIINQAVCCTVYVSLRMTLCRNQRLGAICGQLGPLRGLRLTGRPRQYLAQRTEKRQHSQHAVADGAGNETGSAHVLTPSHNVQ